MKMRLFSGPNKNSCEEITGMRYVREASGNMPGAFFNRDRFFSIWDGVFLIFPRPQLEGV